MTFETRGKPTGSCLLFIDRVRLAKDAPGVYTYRIEVRGGPGNEPLAAEIQLDVQAR